MYFLSFFFKYKTYVTRHDPKKMFYCYKHFQIHISAFPHVKYMLVYAYVCLCTCISTANSSFVEELLS